MKLRLFVVAIVSSIFFIGLSSVESHGKREIGPSKDRKICTNEACEIAAKSFKSYMDTCYDPCDDFHKFVCGNFLAEAVIKTGRDNTTFDQMDDVIEERLNTILETKFCEGCALMDYYKSCMNTNAIECDGDESMMIALRELFGGWHLVDGSWDGPKADLTKVMTIVLKYGLPNFFEVSASVDEQNSSVRIITMKQNSLLKFRPSYYTDENCNEEIDAYKTSITNVAKALSKRKELTNETEKNAEEIIALETNLSKILYQPEESNNLTQEKITLCSLAVKFKEVVNMTAIVEKLFGDVGIKIDGEELIAIYGLGYFDKLAKLLKETPKRTVINYLIWKMFNALLITMPKKYQNYANEPDKVKSSASEVPPRRERCHSLVSRQHLSAIYVKTYFSKTAKFRVKNMFPKLKKTLEGMLSNITWLLPKTKSFALKKLSEIQETIGYPDYYDTESFFEDTVDIIGYPESESFLRKHLHYRAAGVDGGYKLLRTSVVSDKFGYDVLEVNPGYIPEENALLSPAAVLQWPIFSEDVPMYLNYAGIGTFFAQGIAVGLSPYGNAWYEVVNLQPWWAEEDMAYFVNASKCVEQMYGNFVAEEINKKLNGSKHILTNVGSIEGLKASYMAYQSWKEENGEEPELPDLDFTPEQLFFINYGRIHCEKMLPNSLEIWMDHHTHSLGRFRINGPLMNMKEFSEVFKCKPNSPMNPEKKCKVW